MSLLILLRHNRRTDTWIKVTPHKFLSKTDAEWWLKERIYEGDLDPGNYFIAKCVFLEELKVRLLKEDKGNGPKR